MHPCSQPRYGLIEVSNPTSGLSLRAMTEREASRSSSVLGAGSSALRHASRTTANLWNRLAGLSAAPRPRMEEEIVDLRGGFVTEIRRVCLEG
jgi:hypothetical protein